MNTFDGFTYTQSNQQHLIQSWEQVVFQMLLTPDSSQMTGHITKTPNVINHQFLSSNR